MANKMDFFIELSLNNLLQTSKSFEGRPFTERVCLKQTVTIRLRLDSGPLYSRQPVRVDLLDLF